LQSVGSEHPLDFSNLRPGRPEDVGKLITRQIVPVKTGARGGNGIRESGERSGVTGLEHDLDVKLGRR
jgi:hypothetical protein